MPSFEDIDANVAKAQGDRARLLKSREGLLPHFDFPDKEEKEEKHYSKETLLADMYEERLEKIQETMKHPTLLQNAYKELQSSATWGSEKEGENTGNASYAFHTLSSFITTDAFSHLSPEKQTEVNIYIEHPLLIENVYKDLQYDAKLGSEKEGQNTGNASLAFCTLSSLIATDAFSHLSSEKQTEVNAYIEHPILLENAYKYLQNNAIEGSKKEGEGIASAFSAFRTFSSLITTNALSHLSPEKQTEVNAYIEHPILLENIYEYLQNNAKWGSEEGQNTGNASWAFWTLSFLTTIKDYLREKGKKTDDERFAKEALNPTKNIPPRPEGRGY